jgi:hypothetical protein
VTEPNDRGGALVEAALVIPILLFILCSIIEIGGALKSYSGTASAVRQAGRSASLAGSAPDADGLILQEVARRVAAIDDGEIELVVIWHADGPGDAVPPACLPPDTAPPNTSSVGVVGTAPDHAGACNAYIEPDAPGGAFAMAQGTAGQPVEHYFGCAGPADPAAYHKLDCNWPATSRNVLTSPRGSTDPTTTDFVGVYIRVRHASYTGVLGGGLTITDRSISLMEPQGYAVS